MNYMCTYIFDDILWVLNNLVIILITAVIDASTVGNTIACTWA